MSTVEIVLSTCLCLCVSSFTCVILMFAFQVIKDLNKRG